MGVQIVFYYLFFLFFYMLGKENRVPNKQGVMYELNINKDQGAYLRKDIMHSNPKSIALLTGSQIVKSFSTLNQTLKFN